jgi:hypothetical protein
LEGHKTSFNVECSKLLDERKQTTLQWLQNPSHTNGDNLNSIRHETSRTFRTEEGISENGKY